ncbi:MAG: hypothetical protein H0S79_13450 [Anaerolineaceae bacterium]|nr:hypothetical protein [Anaerolineaceae bacterium]
MFPFWKRFTKATHGIGLLKKAYLEDALGEVSVDVQRRIKAALDPAGILNPGKVL